MNYTLFQLLNEQAGQNPILDTLIIFCADWLIFCFPLLLLFFWGMPLSWRSPSSSEGKALQTQERRGVVLWAIVAGLMSVAMNLLIEQFISEPRPFISHHVHLLIQHAADGSFPSDHTAMAFAIAGMPGFNLLARFMSVTPSAEQRTYRGTMRWFFFIALVMACTIGVARVCAGVHYPGDIVGGAFDGLLAAFIATLLRLRLQSVTNFILALLVKYRLA